jgi:hypothetical protein
VGFKKHLRRIHENMWEEHVEDRDLCSNVFKIMFASTEGIELAKDSLTIAVGTHRHGKKAS